MEFENWVLLQWAFWIALIALLLALASLAWQMIENRRRAEWEKRHEGLVPNPKKSYDPPNTLR